MIDRTTAIRNSVNEVVALCETIEDAKLAVDQLRVLFLFAEDEVNPMDGLCPLAEQHAMLGLDMLAQVTRQFAIADLHQTAAVAARGAYIPGSATRRIL